MLKQCSSQLVLTPAYGRKYLSESDMLRDWRSGKDFKILGGPYCSIRDWEAMRQDASTVTLLQCQGNLSVTL